MRTEDRGRIRGKLAAARLLLDARAVAPEEALGSLLTACRAALTADPRLVAAEHRLARAHERWLRDEPASLDRDELLALADQIERALPPDPARGRALARRAAFAAAALAGAIALGGMAWELVTAPAADEGLLGTYFPAVEQQGQPFQRLDPDLRITWRQDAPMLGIPADGFSAAWEGCVVVDDVNLFLGMAGTDAFRVWLDDELVIERWDGEQDWDWVWHPVPLRRGVHPIRVEIEHYTGEARIRLGWRLGRAGPVWTVPPSALVPPGGNRAAPCRAAGQRS